MEPPLCFPVPKIKEEEDDASDIIDLVTDRTPEDLIFEWDSRVRKKIKDYFIVDSEQTLDTLMKWYIQTIKDEAVNYDDFKTLKMVTAKHIRFFKLYFIELNCCFVENYLDNMEDILAFYCNIEIQSLPTRRKDSKKNAFKKIVSSVYCKILCILNVFLLNRKDRLWHVIMKIKLNLQREECREMMNYIYGNLLTKKPQDKTDLEFCRAYILYQKWKTIRKAEEWEQMDEIMYNIYDRTAESVQTNETLRQILFPQNNSVLDTFIHIREKHIMISEEYFKFIKSRKVQEDSLIASEISNLELQDELISDLFCDEENQEFDKAYNKFVKTISNISEERSDDNVEEASDDDCQIVGVSSLGCESVVSADLIHEILDDGDLEIIYLKKREHHQSPIQKNKKSTEISFLESIQLPDPTVQVEKVSSRNTPPVLQSTDNVLSKSTRTSIDKRQRNNLNQPSPMDILNDSMIILESQSNSAPITEENVINMEIETETSRDSSAVKSVTNTETQTEYCNQIISVSDSNNCDCNVDKSQLSEKHPEQNDINRRSIYYYGLVTPPSDQPHDEHNASTTESVTYPNVYANIVRTHNSPDKTDNMPKVPENDYLLTSVEDDGENNCKNLPSSSEITPTVTSPTDQNKCKIDDQCISQSDEDSNISFDMEFEPDIQPNAKKKPDDNTMDMKDDDHSSYQVQVITKEKNGCSNDYRSPSPYTSLSIQTGFCNDVTSRSPSPNKGGDIIKSSEGSPNVQCTSTDFIVTSHDFPPISNNVSLLNSQNNTNISCTSPDITSTSTEIQDYQECYTVREGDSEVNDTGQEHLSGNVLEMEDPCIEEYVEYSECHTENEEFRNDENVTQSNLEDGEVVVEEIFIEDSVLMNNVDEIPFITGEQLPDGASVNIFIENHCDELSSHSNPSSPNRNEILNIGVAKEKTLLNKKNISSLPSNELKVAVEKINIDSTESKTYECKQSRTKIMFTSAERVTLDDFSKFQETVHLQYKTLKDTHDLDEIFSGPVSKMNGTNGCVNPDTNFDLFSNSKSSPISLNASTNSSGEITSPAYERIDDFRNYFEENKNNSMLNILLTHNKLTVEDRIMNSPIPFARISRPILKTNKSKISAQVVSENLKNQDSGGENSDICDVVKTKSQNNMKRPHISFAEDIDESNVIPRSTTETTNNVLQSILKKPSSHGENIQTNGKRVTRPRIPRRLMNLKSLAQYNVKPNDPCIQGVPCVVIERLSDSEISQWLRVSEISRKVRLQKQQAQYASSQVIYRMDYIKNTSEINENDTVQYNTSKGVATKSLPQKLGQWRSNAIVHSKSSRLEEGLNSNDLPYTEKKTGKRKRQNSQCSYNSQTLKKGPGRPRKKY